jgi:hypothetical protein
MLAIKLDKEIPCDYICHSIQKLIDNYRQNNNIDLSNAVLVVDIKTIIETNQQIPLLNHLPADIKE